MIKGESFLYQKGKNAEYGERDGMGRQCHIVRLAVRAVIGDTRLDNVCIFEVE